MSTTINERIKTIIETTGINANSMANRIGVAATVIYNIIGERKSKPSFDVLKKILEEFDNIDPDWLLSGEGHMMRKPRTAAATPPTNTSESIFPIVVDQSNTEMISLVPIYAQAGYLRGFEDSEFIKNLPVSGPALYDDGTYRDFEIKGDSMEEYFFERDIVRARYLPEIYWENKLHQGELFVIIHQTEGVVFKQVIDHQVSTGDITLHSFNSYYKDYTINLRDVQQLWYYTEYRSSRKFRYIR